jgi:hypothetical protein
MSSKEISLKGETMVQHTSLTMHVVRNIHNGVITTYCGLTIENNNHNIIFAGDNCKDCVRSLKSERHNE